MFSSLVLLQIAFAATLTGAVNGSAAAPKIAPALEHKVYGTVQSLSGNVLVIRTRSGRILTVDGHLARSSVVLRRSRPVIVYGTTDSAGVLHATSVWRTFPDAAHWPADR